MAGIWSIADSQRSGALPCYVPRRNPARSPLHLAAKEGQAEVCRALLAAGADPNAKDGAGLTPLHHVSGSSFWSMGRSVGARGIIAIQTYSTLKQALGEAEEDSANEPPPRPAEVCRLLIAAGADFNAKDADGRTPLHYAAHNSLLEVCRVLLDAGADPNAKDMSGDTPLDYTKMGGRAEAARVIRAAIESKALESAAADPILPKASIRRGL